jgi:hypothetical protein
MIDTAVILKRFEEPDEVRTFDSCRSAIRIGCFKWEGSSLAGSLGLRYYIQ